MEKLRIHRTKYRNRGQANKKLKGQQEHHVVFKFDTEDEAKGFITQVKDWYYSLELVKDTVIDTLNEPKDEPPKIDVKKIPRKRPGPQKGQGGRPNKKNIQRQGK